MAQQLPTEHEMHVRVRYKETDAMGVLHHANYFVYFEMGRTELLRASGISYRDLEDQGLLMVVVRIDARYRKPARYDDLLLLRTKTKRISPAKIEHEYEIFRDGEMIATGNSTLACVNREGQVVRVPEWLRTDS